MRSYGQYCALAKALDVVGDRWTLLIVRELLTQGPCRYTDLRRGLPGIATNLLADRLRELEEAGILWREEAPPPVAATLFHLTPRGAALEPVLLELGRWGAPLMAKAGQDEGFCSHWLALPLKHLLQDRNPGQRAVSIELRSGDAPITVAIAGGAIKTRPGPAQDPDLVLEGSPHLIIALLFGKLDVSAACSAGLIYRGDPTVLQRLKPAKED